jgi:hypothetical protein
MPEVTYRCYGCGAEQAAKGNCICGSPTYLDGGVVSLPWWLRLDYWIQRRSNVLIVIGIVLLCVATIAYLAGHMLVWSTR